MHLSNLNLLMAAPQGESGGFMMFLPFIAIIAIFYFLIIRPQNKKQKETQQMLSMLKKGDRIVTIGGIHGTIQTVREQTVIVKVDEDTKMEFSRSAIASIVAAEQSSKTPVESSAPDQAAQSKNTKKIPWAKITIFVVAIIVLLVVWLSRERGNQADEQPEVPETVIEQGFQPDELLEVPEPVTEQSFQSDVLVNDNGENPAE